MPLEMFKASSDLLQMTAYDNGLVDGPFKIYNCGSMGIGYLTKDILIQYRVSGLDQIKRTKRGKENCVG